MPVYLARWLAERPVDPTAEYPVGETFTPPSRLDSIFERVAAGEAVTLTAEQPAVDVKVSLVRPLR
ncbi:MAG: hypothetical protein HC855_05935 [Rhizobiales bacterium]|nr:hypothetical protein [Hyphomicrobiales bacterium]